MSAGPSPFPWVMSPSIDPMSQSPRDSLMSIREMQERLRTLEGDMRNQWASHGRYGFLENQCEQTIRDGFRLLAVVKIVNNGFRIDQAWQRLKDIEALNPDRVLLAASYTVTNDELESGAS